MGNRDFQFLYKTIKKKSLPKEQFELLKVGVLDNYFDCRQCAKIMSVYSFDKDKLKTAMESLYRYNFKPVMREFCNPCRVFSLGGEGGTVMCEYPENAVKPAIRKR